MKFKLISRLGLTILVMVAVALITPVRAVAAGTPGQYEVEIPKGTASVEWDVPTYGNGYLVSFCAVGITNSATLAISHIVPAGDGSAITNVIAATAAANTWYARPTEYTVTNNVVIAPTSLIPGDRLRLTLSATNSRARVVIRTTGR